MGHWPRGKQLPENQIFCATLPAAASSPLHTTPSVRASALPSAIRNLERCFGAVPEDIQAVDLHMQAGNLSYLLGENLGALFVRDSMRVVDYLCGRPDVDTKRIRATDSPAAVRRPHTWLHWTTASAVIPPHTVSHKASDDALWKTALATASKSIVGISAGEGFDYADVLWAAFPKPCMLSAASEDFFLLEGVRQLEGEMRRLYKAAGNAAFFQFR